MAQAEKKRGETKKEKLYVPRVMAETMLAATANSTSTHYGFGHMCRKHNKLFTLEHIENCDEMSGCSNVRRYATASAGSTSWTGNQRRGMPQSLSLPT